MILYRDPQNLDSNISWGCWGLYTLKWVTPMIHLELSLKNHWHMWITNSYLSRSNGLTLMKGTKKKLVEKERNNFWMSMTWIFFIKRKFHCYMINRINNKFTKMNTFWIFNPTFSYLNLLIDDEKNEIQWRR